ncbi:MAG: hypothetical protein IPH24_14350 [Crocinitomicaceae bacterium]|jgi:hypothetical protein|nr:hypothetical protein [Crocinitomicaceae bacterium]
MFKNFFANKQNSTPLQELDELYRNTIQNLTIEQRLAYCQRLLERTKFELKSATLPETISAMKELESATLDEIKNLNKK